MKKVFVTAVISLLVMGSAFAQKDCDELALKYERSKKAFNSLQERYNSLQFLYSELLDQTQERKNLESEALFYVKDWYDFFNRDYIYKNVKIRKHSENKYYISLMEKRKDLSSWDAVIYHLSIYEEGRYNMSQYGFGDI